MKTNITIIFLMLLAIPFPMYASRYSSSGEAAFAGAIQGILIMGIIWLIGIFRKKKKKNNNNK